jgi:hypothetical protein
MKTELVRIEELTLDADVNIRTDLDEETVLRYMETLDELPPVSVTRTSDGALILTDGFHRTEAAARLGRTELFANVKNGTREQAIEDAALANLKHGLPLTEEELEDAVWRLSRKPPHGPGLSQMEIARKTGRSRGWVQGKLARHAGRGLGRVSVDQAQKLKTLPPDLRAKVAATVQEQELTDHETRVMVNEVLKNPDAVREVITEAAPHLKAMADRVRYVRIMDAALNGIRQLDQIGITPARLAGLVNDPAMAERWQRDLPIAEEYVTAVKTRFKRGPQKLRAVEGDR